jgi:uracil-DNA glycosylase family 4
MLEPNELTQLNERIIACMACPRLVAYLAAGRARCPEYWSRPVPGIGDARARLLVVGLAPGFHGANRTGRPFCVDASGVWLWRALFEAGATASAEAPASGEELTGVYVTNAVRCAPPGNRPTAVEFAACRPFLRAELELLDRVAVVLALGRSAHDACLRLRREAGEAGAAPFAHGAAHRWPDRPHLLIDSYHPSRQNTQTGRLTWPMFRDVVARAVALAGEAGQAPQSGQAQRDQLRRQI